MISGCNRFLATTDHGEVEEYDGEALSEINRSLVKHNRQAITSHHGNNHLEITNSTQMIRSVVFFILLAVAPYCVEADDYYTYFTLEDGGNVTCSGNYIESAILELDCDDDYCPLGTAVTLTGDVTVGSNGLPSESASIDLSISGYSVYDWENVNMCEYLQGGGCPNEGTYSISEYSLDLPDPSSSLSLAGSMGMAISVGANIYFENGESEQCSFKIALVNRNTGYSLGYVGLAGFMIFGVGTTLGIKRRKVATLQLQQEDTEGTHNHFELMPQEGGVQV